MRWRVRSGPVAVRRRTGVSGRAALGGAIAAGLLAAAGLASAPSARAGVPCAPATLNNSAILAGSVTVSPLPGSRDASRQTQISFVGVRPQQLAVTRVVGSRSGVHPGRLIAYSQGDGASFVPARPFIEGELVTVHAKLKRGSRHVPLFDQFAIERHDPISTTPEKVHPVGHVGVQSYVSRPDLQPPAVTVTAQSPAAAPGDVFVAPYSGPGQAGPMILDPAGNLVWFKPLPPNTSATNFQVQEYLGKPMLTWWQGDISIHGFGLGYGVIADSTYSEVARVSAGNGLQADLHEFQLTPQGTALITAYDTQLCDTSALGGPAGNGVTDGILQEIDIKTGLVRFQWTSLDHVALADSYTPTRGTSTEWPFDFFHLNSIDREPDGALLLSSRNTWAIYEIDPRSGQVSWRLGGKRSSFALGAGAGTAWQHDSRLLPNGTVSIFDNGAAPIVHRQSRGIVIGLDARHRKAKVVSRFTRPSPIVAESQGNVQALANGDWFIGWGQVSDFSEFNAAGQLLFDAHMPAHVQSYRSFRLPWEATPLTAPEFVLQGAAGARVIYASWNGATRVVTWRVLAGPTATSMHTVVQAARGGFETAIALPPETVEPLVTVQALDATEAVIGTAEPKPLGG
jgi:hypothetical protein